VLYEGYILYPYRPSVKTQQRWTFGGIYPQAYSEAQQGNDPWSMQTQCLIRADENATVSVAVRFLHLTLRTAEAKSTGRAFHAVSSIEVGGRMFQTWQEAVERKIELGDITLGDLLRQPRREAFNFPRKRSIELLKESDGHVVGRLVREQQAIDGIIEFSVERKSDSIFQMTARALNQTPLAVREQNDRELAQLKSFASTHMVLTTRGGEFVSLTDPPQRLCDISSQCKNVGCWPVLVGEANSTDTLLASPIILSDYPEIAPESPGDLFDGCEIDEILTLRIMTLTDEEKRQAIAVDPLAADMMARTEALAREQLMNLHGTVRNMNPVMQENRHG
jgi:hypothetical protein